VAFEFEEDVKRSLIELESKKVFHLLNPLLANTFTFPPQIDNFKLPLTHITEPFVTKIRYTPACASKRERLEKDLEHAKKLVAVYETQATQLAAYKPVWPVGAPADAPVPEQENGLTTEDDEDEGRNPNRGSTAVAERIDKLVSERCDTDEDGNPSGIKKVPSHPSSCPLENRLIRISRWRSPSIFTSLTSARRSMFVTIVRW